MTPDLVVINADIRTMDPTRPVAQGMAIAAGRITALGSSADIRAMAGAASRVIDAGGRLVLPGFIDAHAHLIDGGLDLVMTAPLAEETTIAGLQQAMATHAAQYAGPLVMGGGWSNAFFGDGNLTRAVLDVAVPDRPCIVYDDSTHSACLNAVACDMAGITSQTPDPPNGHLVRDADGAPTGMLHEDAIFWARARLPAISDAAYLAGARAGQAHANQHGLTGVLDPSVTGYQERAYATLAAEGGMTLRVAGAARVDVGDSLDDAVTRLVAMRAVHRTGFFQIHSAKFFLDGIFENRTAAMLAPYADAQGGNAPLMFAPDMMAALFCALDAARFQIHVHCIGDGATRAALDGFAAARAVNGAWPSLHQIAHVQVVDPADMPRFAALGVMANMQPLWACDDPDAPDDTLAMIGPARVPHTYPFASLINAGATHCINSDWPVTTLNPFEIIATAVSRVPSHAHGRAAPFLPQERLTVLQCVQGYTTQAAAACWWGHLCGALRPGLSGDFIVLDRDIFACDAQAIAGTQVLLTVLAGQSVWQSGTFGG